MLYPLTSSEKTWSSFEDDCHEQDCHYDSEQGQTYHSGHNIWLRQILPAMLILVAVGGLLAWKCINWHNSEEPGFDNLERRLNPSARGPIIACVVFLVMITITVLLVRKWNRRQPDQNIEQKLDQDPPRRLRLCSFLKKASCGLL